MSEESRLLLVTYSATSASSETLLQMEPEFKPDGNTKDETLKAAQIAKKRQKWVETSVHRPYTGLLDQVYLGDPTAKLVKFASGEQSEALPKVKAKKGQSSSPPSPVELQICEWLESEYRSSWTRNIFDTEPGLPVVLLGFDTRSFLQMVGVECARHGRPAPIGMWLNGANCREVTSLGCAAPDTKFSAVCQYLGIQLPAGWTTPHVDPQADMSILLQFVSRLRLLDRPLNLIRNETKPAKAVAEDLVEETVNA